MNALKALAPLLLLACTQKAVSDSLVKPHDNGSVVPTSTQGYCPPTYATAYLTATPDKRIAGCWGLQGRTVWVFLPMRLPMDFSIEDFEVLR